MDRKALLARVNSAHGAIQDAYRIAYDHGNRPPLWVRVALHAIETRLLRLSVRLERNT